MYDFLGNARILETAFPRIVEKFATMSYLLLLCWVIQVSPIRNVQILLDPLSKPMLKWIVVKTTPIGGAANIELLGLKPRLLFIRYTLQAQSVQHFQ